MNESPTAWLEREIEKLNSKKEGLFQAYENVAKVEKQLIMDIYEGRGPDRNLPRRVK